VAVALETTAAAQSEGQLAERFMGRGPWKKRLPQILETLVALGRARQLDVAGQWRWRQV
jgi:hypothetical protein